MAARLTVRITQRFTLAGSGRGGAGPRPLFQPVSRSDGRGGLSLSAGSGLPVNEVGHSGDGESDLTVFGCVDEALADQAGADGPEVGLGAVQPCRDVGSTCWADAVGGHGCEVEPFGGRGSVPP